MSVVFSQYPGRRERHLLRKRNNPLFPEPERTPPVAAVQEAQRLDHEELVEFIGTFRGLIQRAAGLQANEQSEVILKLKEELDQCYEQACGLADDQSETKEALRRLLGVIMQTVEAGAAGDPLAQSELRQERAARAAHQELLEHPLVADLLYPESPIRPGELVPTLLSAPEAQFNASLGLFDPDQLREILDAAGRLAGEHGGDLEPRRQALERLLQSTRE
ncbi:MAG: hypothetical protein B0D96_08785 [Candidatus Sedimenticola endophacoides]|uniref:Uncharacterized protein n=1 Tax=Candidatus Sedimenticola endophacoides TaxID=2548426 RepID=A0A6N4E2R0_9GAMM|nr:MAG: hypothetical protein B0D94_10705 [Candidatus Sedimenticola endophacoides]OQX34667.1 MAG: hypothetical protein B0D96_08785 [Candidatus Sedimenticola endophacoides]OQX41502.1 MAG: hypothetical protein B0D89_03865 [Candidatus Sedimenticola endophacoides]PUD98202.1 MAG: hypothetical protein C3L26_13295 [Candidatus Sedimenticola endophacoides]PUE00858.1 MAG: hypothetical protein C3L25_13200 [Candidatus Sedimenticola endophacoides]